jgi:cell division protein FtsB
MSNKNPYEKKEELDIPDFIEDKTNSDSSIDMSIFKMSDDELYDDVTDETDEYDEDYEDYQPKRKRKGNGPVIVCLIIIFLLLAALAGSVFYALKQHEAYVKANTAYLQVQANEDNYKKQIAEQGATIEALNKQIEEMQKNDGSIGEGDIVYEITDGGMRFRVEPTSDAELTTYNGYSQVETGEKYRVLEVVNDKDLGDQYTWAKLADNVYFCLGEDEEWVKRIS